jgi:hypothetical protein
VGTTALSREYWVTTSKEDALKTQQAQSATELDALLHSILGKTFKGELCERLVLMEIFVHARRLLRPIGTTILTQTA